MTEVINYLQNEGIPATEFIPDGIIKRVAKDKNDKKKNCWYIGHQNYTRSGDLFHLVIYGDWSTSDGVKTYNTLQGKISKEDRVFIDEKIRQAQKKHLEEKNRLNEEVSQEVTEKWATLSLSGESEYLNRKKINPSGDELGIRYDNFNGDIYVPVTTRDSKIWSLEKIDRNGNKFFNKGGRLSGCFHIVGKIGDGPIYFAEGFSTSASIHYATSEGVVCCFSSTNLDKVVNEFRRHYPERRFIVCGDDDRGRFRPDGTQFNPGREAAESVAKKYFCIAKFPIFSSVVDDKATDFNDLHVLEGIDAVKSQLLDIDDEEFSEPLSIQYLGYSGETYFFSSTYNKQVIGFSNLSESNLVKLMPMDYWEMTYPGRGEKSRVDWAMAKDELIGNCHKKGLFQSKNIRGSGVWLDGGRIVVNMGDHLIVNGEKTSLNGLKSKNFYTLGTNLERLRENPLTVKDCSVLVKSCLSFKWAKDEFGMLLAGALVTSRICGALPIRPHVWISGGAATGKTTLVEKLIQIVLGNNKLYVQGNTTEAGVRQSLRADAIPVLFDEFETSGRSSDENISNLIELMRASWSDSQAMIVKGGASGNASHYQVRFSAIVSSIRTKLINDADRGRFAVLELVPHEGDQAHWLRLSGLLDKIDSEYAERLFARTVGMAQVLLDNFKIIRSVFATKVSSRFGDQYGMLLAGYCVLIYDGVIDKNDAEFLVSQFNLEDEKSESKDSDHDDALNHLLTTKISYEGAGGVRTEDTIGQMVVRAINGHSAENKALIKLGIRAEFGFVSIVQANHSELERAVWRGTKWSNIWGKSLSRIIGASKNQSIWFTGIGNKKCVKIPVKHLLET